MTEERLAPLNREVREWISREILPHEAEVRRWLVRATPRGLDPSDVIQEAYSRIARFKSDTPVQSGRAYFYAVVRNVLRDHFRRAHIVQIEPLSEIDQLRVLDDSPHAERVCAGRQELRIVWRLLDQLPDRCRKIFLLRKLEGLSQREIATRMGVTENIVEKQVSLGLRLLLKLLAEQTIGQLSEDGHDPENARNRASER